MSLFDIFNSKKEHEVRELKKDIEALTKFSELQVIGQHTYNISTQGLSSTDFNDDALVKLWEEVPEISTVIYQISSRAKNAPWGHFKIKDKTKFSKFEKAFTEYTHGRTTLDKVIQLREDSLKPVFDNDIARILRNPNELESWGAMIEKLIDYYYVIGNGYLIKNGVFGFTPEELLVMASQQTDVVINDKYLKDPFKRKEGDSAIKEYTFNNGYGTINHYDPELVLHIKASNIQYKNGAWKKGYSPLAAAILASKTLRQEYLSRLSLIKDRGMMGMVVGDGKGGVLPTPEETDALHKRLKKFGLGDGKINSYGVTNGAYKWLNMSFNSGELELLKGREENLKVLARKMNVPTDLLIGESAFNNVNTNSKVIYTSNVIPWLNDLQNKLNPFLGLEEKGEIIMPIYDNIAELQQDLKTQSEVYGGLYEKGIVTQQEARVGVNLPPKGEGDFKDDTKNNNDGI
jgi:phage portal protein BeeE